MIIHHHSLIVELPDSCWTEAGMEGFVAKSGAYHVDRAALLEQEIREILIADIGPVERAAGVGVFNESEEGVSAHDRVMSILRGIFADAPIPPVAVSKPQEGQQFRYKLLHGSHRLYCSLAAGFVNVPAVEGFEWGNSVR